MASIVTAAAKFVSEESASEVVQDTKNAEKNVRVSRLPLTRIKNIMKMDSDVNLASQEAVFLVAKATELFVESLARESYHFTLQSKKKTLQKKDVDSSVDAVDAFVFLEGTLD